MSLELFISHCHWTGLIKMLHRVKQKIVSWTLQINKKLFRIKEVDIRAVFSNLFCSEDTLFLLLPKWEDVSFVVHLHSISKQYRKHICSNGQILQTCFHILWLSSIVKRDSLKDVDKYQRILGSLFGNHCFREQLYFESL